MIAEGSPIRKINALPRAGDRAGTWAARICLIADPVNPDPGKYSLLLTGY